MHYCKAYTFENGMTVVGGQFYSLEKASLEHDSAHVGHMYKYNPKLQGNK